MIPYIAVRRPTKYEVENCERISLTSKFDWDIFVKGGIFSKVEYHLNNIESVLESFEVTDPISENLSCLSLGAMISDTTVLHQSKNTVKEKINDEDMYCTVGAGKTRSLPSLSP